MFGFGEKPRPPQTSANHAMRETLFGDMPWEKWAKPAQEEPSSLFYAARTCFETGNRTDSIALLRRITEMPGLESRFYLQAWHFLRSMGEQPAGDTANQVLGVVIEMGMQDGFDLLAGYRDGSARYWNFSGSGIVWDSNDDAQIADAVKILLDCGQIVSDQIGIWLEPRRPAPRSGIARLSMLSPSGLRFGEGPAAVLARDPMGGPLLSAGTSLMQKLIARAQPEVTN